MMCKDLWRIAVLLLLSAKTMGQSFLNSVPSISMSYLNEPNRDFKTADGGFDFSALAIKAKIPLPSKNNVKDHFFKSFLQADIQSSTANFGFTRNHRMFVNGALGFGALWAKNNINLYLINASAGLAADSKVIKNGEANVRFAGTFLVNHRHNQNTTYLYGAVFTYAFARPLLLPLAGLRTQLSDHWRFTAILPLQVSFSNQLSQKVRLNFSLHPSGNRYQFYNNNNFNTIDSVVFMQQRDFKLGTGLTCRVSPTFTISAEAGLLVGGKLNFTQVDGSKISVFQTKVKPGGIFQVTLRYQLPRKSKADDDGLDNMLNIMGN